MSKKVLIEFSNDEEEKKFIAGAKKFYKDRDDGSYLGLEYIKSPEETQQASKNNFIDFLYTMSGIVLVGCMVWFFIVKFQDKPEPIIKTNTVVVTGNTYNVTVDTTKLPAIGSLVYYYDNTITTQKGAKLNQIRIDSDGVTRYNICLKDEAAAPCIGTYDEANNCSKFGEAPYSNCFDTSLIGSTEQQLKDGICNK